MPAELEFPFDHSFASSLCPIYGDSYNDKNKIIIALET
jgi:hypothetical protein